MYRHGSLDRQGTAKDLHAHELPSSGKASPPPRAQIRGTRSLFPALAGHSWCQRTSIRLSPVPRPAALGARKVPCPSAGVVGRRGEHGAGGEMSPRFVPPGRGDQKGQRGNRRRQAPSSFRPLQPSPTPPAAAASRGHPCQTAAIEDLSGVAAAPTHGRLAGGNRRPVAAQPPPPHPSCAASGRSQKEGGGRDPRGWARQGTRRASSRGVRGVGRRVCSRQANPAVAAAGRAPATWVPVRVPSRTPSTTTMYKQHQHDHCHHHRHHYHRRHHHPYPAALDLTATNPLTPPICGGGPPSMLRPWPTQKGG